MDFKAKCTDFLFEVVESEFNMNLDDNVSYQMLRKAILKEYKGLNEVDLRDFLEQSVIEIKNKGKRNFHTISSSEDFQTLLNNDGSKEALVYKPLNEHSRKLLFKGDVLFSYKTGQAKTLSEALIARGIYGVGIAVTDPFIIKENILNPSYKDYGILVYYPTFLKTHLTIRDIQLNPKTIDLTPYNGNRNDALQHIPKESQYETLLGMLVNKNPELNELFNQLNLQINSVVIPDEFWEEHTKERVTKIVQRDYKSDFRLWMNEETNLSKKTQSNYYTGINTFEREWNKVQAEKIDIWNDPEVLFESYTVQKLIKVPEISKVNEGQNNTLSAALNQYYSFLDSLKHKNTNYGENNKIYFGAPGTGKSYQLKKDSKLFSESNVERVTFHPNMSYGQFIGAFKPFPYREQATNESKITYKFVPGVLMKQLLKALSSPNEAFLLIIEEINRANVSAVFGDFFQLLDRDETNSSEYPITISEDIKFYLEEEVYKNSAIYNIENIRNAIQSGFVLPSNLFLWSTMNSSDQGILPMDTAFKRRWEQRYFGINQAYENNKEEFEGYSKVICGERKVQWNMIREFLNKQLIKVNVPEDKLMGPYFISKNILTSSEEKLTNSFKNKVLMYLFEDAGKQYRRNLFNLAPDKMIYSEVIKAFEEMGLELFKESSQLISELVEDDSNSIIDESL